MVTVDEFESQFRRSAKEHFKYEERKVERITFLADEDFKVDRAREFASSLFPGEELQFVAFSIDLKNPVSEVVAQVVKSEPDVVFSTRLLGHPKETSHSLGTYVDELSQVLETPLVLLPNQFFEEEVSRPSNTLIVSESIVGDSELVNWGVAFSEKKGKLVLADFVDGNAFDDYMGLIAKSTLLDTNMAQGELESLILKLATEFEAECIEVLKGQFPDLKLEQIVDFARSVKDYQRVINEHGIDILLLSGKDHNQTAMSALSHALSVEITDIPLVLV